MPLGSGALAGNPFAIDRKVLASDLGFESITHNSMDGVRDRDFIAEFLFWATLTMLHLSRFAEDLIIYSSREFGFVTLADAYSTGSSLMPQKKNPDALELIRGKTGRQIGNLVTILTVLKGLPLAYNKDQQEDKEPLFDCMEHLSMCLRMAAIVLDGMTINRERCRAAALGGYSNATELADYLVSKGLPFRDAHHVAGRLVREAIIEQKPLEGLSVEQMASVDSRIGADVYTALTVDSALRKRDVPGGTAPGRVAELLGARKARLGHRRVRTPMGGVTIRKARMADLDGIVSLVEHWAREGENLPRSRDEIMECVQEFAVAQLADGSADKVVGCGSLWVYTPQLAEIRSLGIDPSMLGHGIGQKLVQYFLDWAAKLGLQKVFVLTRTPRFFERCGFRQVSVNSLPEKVLKDCANCPKKEQCDEIAMVFELAPATATST